ncbi:MAG: nucleotidyltransferase family protein [Myxococcota bacterium]
MTRASAFILAAGLGTRLRPLTLTTPKPLLPVKGRPMLDHVLAHLHAHGHTRVVANAHWLAAQIEAWGKARGVAVVTEPVILGTGGGLKNARDLLDARFVVVNGDILSDVDLTALRDEPAPAVMALRRQDAPVHTGVSLVDGVVRGIAGVVGEGDPALHFTGVHALDRAVLDLVPDGPQCIVRTAYRALVPEGRVRGIVHPGAWTDIGTLAEYEAAR